MEKLTSIGKLQNLISKISVPPIQKHPILLMLRHIQWKALVLKSLFNKLYQKETPGRVFSYEYCKIFEKSIF